VNVSLEGLLQVVHHLLGALRSPNPKGNLSAKDPSGQVQIRNANQMVGVQMSQEQPVHVRKGNSEL
jgi:hypothetical protein